MRLFTALCPPPEAVAALDGELSAAGADWPPEGWRRIPPLRWHVLLAFHGDDADPGAAARRLEAALAGGRAPLVRLAGAGFLPRLAYVRLFPVAADDRAAVAELVAGAGGPAYGAGDDAVPRVAVARSRGGRGWPPADSPLHRHRGPSWRPEHVCLVQSSPTPAPPRYRVVHRVPLTGTNDPGW